jgi:hypothetical protein
MRGLESAGTDRRDLLKDSPPAGSQTRLGSRQQVGQHLVSGLNLGLDHFGLVAPFDRGILSKELEQAGAAVVPQVTSGPDASAIDSRDLNGVRVQVSSTPKPRP